MPVRIIVPQGRSRDNGAMESVWIYENSNPLQRRVGDCAVRAVAKALDCTWEDAYALITANGYAMGDMPSSDSVWGSVLRQSGFYRSSIPNRCPDCYTAADFCYDHPQGTYVLAFGGHVATVQDGHLYDTWDSSDLVPLYYYHEEEPGNGDV